jgi:two-component system, LytTR family, sensor kinase
VQRSRSKGEPHGGVFRYTASSEVTIMINSTAKEGVVRNEVGHYWLGQVVFWFCLSVAPFLGMALWYNTLRWVHIEHMLLQSLLGLLMSIPLGHFYLSIWKLPLVLRIVLVVSMVGLVSGIWTWVRVYTFVWLTEKPDTWSEFGGWYFGAFYIFLCWSAWYHGQRYYSLLKMEHGERLREMALVKEEQIKRLEAETVARDAQLKMLRYQINPHFLFNTLHSICALVKTGQPAKATGMINKLGRFLRSTLDYNPAHSVSLADEIDTIKLYLDIETVRFSDRLAITYHIEQEALAAQVPGLILQPLIENSIKYAIADSAEGGTIVVNARVLEQQLFLEVIDSGAAASTQPTDALAHRGIGLRNTLERLQVLYDNRYSFNLEPQMPQGLRVTVCIPYEPVGLVQGARYKKTG